MDFLNPFELPVLDWIRNYIANPVLDVIMPIITHFCEDGIGWIILAVILLCFRKTRKAGITMAIALIIGLLLCNLTLKPLIARTRPFVYNPDIELIIKQPGEYSFPSGHSVTSFEGAFAVYLYNKKWGIPALIFAGLIALSRLYLYVHYPTDVIIGSLLGCLFAWAAYLLVNWIQKEWEKKRLTLQK